MGNPWEAAEPDSRGDSTSRARDMSSKRGAVVRHGVDTVGPRCPEGAKPANDRSRTRTALRPVA